VLDLFVTVVVGFDGDDVYYSDIVETTVSVDTHVGATISIDVSLKPLFLSTTDTDSTMPTIQTETINFVQKLYPQIETQLQFFRMGKSIKDDRVNEKQA
jgi:hypothetical protein